MLNLELENLIENQPKKKNTVIDFVFDTPYFVRSTKYGSIIKKYSKEIVFRNTGSDNYIYFVFGFVIFIFGFRAIGDVFSRYVALFFLLVLLLVFWYNKTKKNEEIKVSDEGIEIEKIKYYWNQIYDYGFTIEPKHKSSTYYLVIFTTLGEKESYGLYNYFDTEEIIITMNFFRNRYNSRRD